MRLSHSVNAKVAVLVAAISFVIVGCNILYNAMTQRSMLENSIRSSAEQFADLVFMNIEKPMVKGDNASTAHEFAEVRTKYPKITAYMTAFSGSITYSTNEASHRQNIQAVVKNPELSATAKDALSRKVSTTLIVEEGGGAQERPNSQHSQCAAVLPLPWCFSCHTWADHSAQRHFRPMESCHRTHCNIRRRGCYRPDRACVHLHSGNS